MGVRTCWGVLVAWLVCFAPSAPANAAPLNQFIFIDGPKTGVSVKADSTGTVNASDNTRVNAAGSINAAHAGCQEEHFHGTVGGSPDPDPTGCGWGRVIARSVAPPILKQVSDAMMFELEAKAHASSDPDSVPGDIAESKGKLHAAKKQVGKLHDEKKINGEQAKVLTDKLQVILDADSAAQTAIANGDINAFNTAIGQAITDKAALVQTLVTDGLVGPRTLSLTKVKSVFYKGGAAGACDLPNNGETCYTVEGKTTNAGATITETWTLRPPVQNQTCNHFGPLAPSTTAVWHHFDNEGPCSHPLEGPDGHEGVVFAVLGDGETTCVVAFLGSKTDASTPVRKCVTTHGDFTLTVVKAAFGPNGTNGIGEITTVPSALVCKEGCPGKSAVFAPGTQVTINADPGRDSAFAGFVGGGCPATGATCQVTMNADVVVMAVFKKG